MTGAIAEVALSIGLASASAFDDLKPILGIWNARTGCEGSSGRSIFKASTDKDHITVAWVSEFAPKPGKPASKSSGQAIVTRTPVPGRYQVEVALPPDHYLVKMMGVSSLKGELTVKDNGRRLLFKTTLGPLDTLFSASAAIKIFGGDRKGSGQYQDRFGAKRSSCSGTGEKAPSRTHR